MVQMHPNRNVPQTRTASSRRLPAMPARVRDAFGDALVREHVLSPAALQAAVDASAKEGIPLYEMVVALGCVEEQVAYSLFARVAGLAYDDSIEVEASPLAITLVPLRVARLHELVPVAVDDKTIRFVTATPYDVDAERDVSFATGRAPVVTLACRSRVQSALERYYPDTQTRHGLQASGAPSAQSGTQPALTATTQPPPASASADSAITLCHGLLVRAVESQASDLVLEPGTGGALVVRMRVAGVVETRGTVPADLAAAVVNRFKVMARVGTAVRNRAQEGTFTFQMSGRRLDVRLSTVPTSAGEKLVLRAADKERSVPALDALGYDADTVTRLTRVLEQRSGLVLVTGPIASGKTTALYAALQHLQKTRRRIISVEEPVEQTVRGVNQISVSARTGSTLTSVMQSAVSQQPDVLMVSELRDAEMAAMAWQAAHHGALVLSSMRTLDSAAAVTHLMNLGLDQTRITECLKAVLDLRLVRRLCPVCRTRGADTSCSRCHGSGYSGIAPLAELLTVTDAIQREITRGQTSSDIRRAMDAAGFPSLADHAATLVTAGVTSRDEITRVLGGAAPAEESPVVTPARKSVLIADDEPITRTLVKLLLERDGYAVIEAQNGRDAVELAVRHIPSLVVMDLNMPMMDGYEAISQIRRVQGLEATPIVVVTMEDGAKVADQVLSLGADDYIMKPFEPSVLTARVKAAFRRQRLAA
jgi:type II secretory ATPase GspE/PulE/Tfp pilus assembly ATPase PilB-like protein/ActR/RegA family two-component response regulator